MAKFEIIDIEVIKSMMNLTDEDLKKPLPVPTKWSKPFWDAAKEHRLILRKCINCGNIDHPPYLYCTVCHSDDHQWIEAQGKGTILAYTVNYFGVPFPFWKDLPYALGIIELVEGVRMISNIVDCDPEQLRNGMEVEVVFDDVTDEITLPKWRPVSK